MSQFNRIASFVVASQIDPTSNTDTETAAEIVAASTDGNTLVYSNSPRGTVGFVDITDPSAPVGLGELDMGGEPTSVAVLGDYALVAVNTSPDFVNPSGKLVAVNISTQGILREWDLGGQPDSIAVSPDGNYVVVAIENERDEDLGDGGLPQLPAGNVVIVDTASPSLINWTTTTVPLTGLPGLTEDTDPEPEFVDISENNIAAVTLQENNAIVLIDLATKTVIRSFSAGTVDLTGVDTVEEDPAIIDQTGTLTAVPREPDGISFIGTDYIATADEGDWNGGSRGFTIYNLLGNVVYTSGNELDQLAAQFGHYPDARSENKGNEPENIEFATIEGTDYLFVNSERSSLVFVYNVDDPTNPVFEQVLPAGSGPEGGKAIPGRNLLVVASENDSRDDVIRSVINIYEYTDAPSNYPTLQSVEGANGAPIPWGAMSGLAAGGGDILYAIEDSFYGSNRFFTIDTSTTPATLTAATTIKDTNDVFAAVAPYGEFDATDLAALINGDKTVNIDPEGIAATGDGYLWIASEGAGTVGDATRPVTSLNFLFKVEEATGTIVEVVTLPNELNDIQVRFGLEGVAYDDGKLVVVLQRAWTGDPNPRVLVYDTATSEWVGDYFYPLDAVESQNGGWVGLSDISPLGNNQYLVLERDNQGGPDAAIKRLYTISILPTLEDGTTLQKTFVRDLIPDFTAAGGLMPEKLEGLAVTQNGVWVINDNDGVDDNSGETQLLKVLDQIFTGPTIGQTTALIPQAGTSTAPEDLLDGGSGDIDFPYGTFKPIATVGEIDPNTGHVLTGYPDGQAAWLADEDTIRVVYQSESYATLSNETYPWVMDSGASFTGSHVHTIDYNRALFADFLNNDSAASEMFEGSGHLFDTIYNVFGEVVTGKNTITTDLAAKWGNQTGSDGTVYEFDAPLSLADWYFHSFCGAYYEQANKYGDGIGFEDDIWLMAEEWNIGDGLYGSLGGNDFFTNNTMGLASVVVDIANETAYTVPVLGQSGYEKILPLNPGSDEYVVLAMSGYNLEVEPAPLRIYIGRKDYDASGNEITDYSVLSDRDAFLARNGLLFGQLYGMAATDETYAALGITTVDADTEMLNAYATNAAAPDTFSVRYYATSYQWDGFDTPENAGDTDVYKWLQDGDNGEADEQPDGYTFFNGDSKVEHPAVDPDISQSRYVINLTDASTILGIDFSNILTDLDNDQDGNGLPDYLSADVTRIVAGVDGALTLETNGKGLAHQSSDLNPSGNLTHSIHVEKGQARLDQPDGLQWVKTADGDYLILDEDSGNDAGERKMILPIDSDTLTLRDPETGYFLAAAGGSDNPRALAGVAAIPGTFSRATSSEFSGTWNVSHLVARKADGSFYTQAELAGTGAQSIISGLPLAEQTFLGVVQHAGESGGVVAERYADQGGQIFLFNVTEPLAPALSAENPFDTTAPAQMIGLNGYTVDPIFTVGESFSVNGRNYTPPGILDGLGAFALDEDTVRVYANHELSAGTGYAYTITQGTADTSDDVQLTGARVSYFDINKNTRQLESAGLAFDKVYNRAGEQVDEASDLENEGFDRFCSAQYIEAEQFGGGRGLADGIFFTGEETGGGTEFALDPDTNTLYAVPWLGRAAWESVTELDTGTTDKIALLVGDDRGGAPMLLYVGNKGEGTGPDFLVRNGLASGQLYVWVATSGETTPEEFNGTGESREGSFVAIDYYRPDLAGNGEYDELGFATQDKQDELAEAVGAFQFSRPEDVATNPADGTIAVMASTGRDSLFPSDSWGTTYIIDTDFSDLNNITANVNAIYDGDDAGAGQFAGSDFGLRSPDNVDWADDGWIYINEDRSYDEFGLTSGEEASIWRLNPNTGELTRVAQMDRTALPNGQTDRSPSDIGNWESSGILDVSTLFGEDPGQLFLFDVQAHSLRDGVIADAGLVQGGQLAFLEAPDDLAPPTISEPPVDPGEDDFGFDPDEPGTNGFFRVNTNVSFELKIQLSATVNITRASELVIYEVDDEDGSIDGEAPDDTPGSTYQEAIGGRILGIMSLLEGLDFNASGLPEGLQAIADLYQFSQIIDLTAGKRFGFLLVEGGSYGDEGVTPFLSNAFSLEGAFGTGGFELKFEGSDLAFSFNVEAKDYAPGLAKKRFGLQTGREYLECLDRRGEDALTGNSVRVYSEAAFDNLVGFYRTNANGDVLSAAGEIRASVGDSNYFTELVANRLNISLSANTTTTIDFVGNAIITPFLVADGTFENFQNIFTPFYSTDNFDHFRLLGSNTFAVEDQFGGGDQDFDDMIIQVTFA